MTRILHRVKFLEVTTTVLKSVRTYFCVYVLKFTFDASELKLNLLSFTSGICKIEILLLLCNGSRHVIFLDFCHWIGHPYSCRVPGLISKIKR